MGFTAEDIPDQRGQTHLITGANSGIGLETARELARAGATVILACRDEARGTDAAADVRSEIPDASLQVEQCDLASLESVRALANRLGDTPLAVLINNAGTMAIPREETADGFEAQFGVNHLGHFALTGLVLEALLEGTTAAAPARIVTVSSGLHERGDIDFEDLHGEGSYDKWDAYAQSKLANVLFAYELERRLKTAGTDAMSVAVHPGYADTQLQFRGIEGRGTWLRTAARRLMNGLLAQSAARGALPTLYAATAEAVEGGGYYGPRGPLKMRGTPERQASSQASYHLEDAQKLWAVSRAQTGVEYDLPRPNAPLEG